jgi:hypothetical protein
MTAILEKTPQQATEQPCQYPLHPVHEDPLVMLSALAELPTEQVIALRKMMGARAVELHATALGASIVLENQRQPSNVEVPAVVIVPKLMSPEQMAGMGIARRLAGRELANHPTDPAKKIIVARKIGYTSTR